MRDGGVLKQTNGGWKACFLVPATSWITSSQNTIDNWNIKLKETEDKLKSEIEKMRSERKTWTLNVRKIVHMLERRWEVSVRDRTLWEV
jgi:hypothetical protein